MSQNEWLLLRTENAEEGMQRIKGSLRESKKQQRGATSGKYFKNLKGNCTDSKYLS